jgi:hypothetical protein
LNKVFHQTAPLIALKFMPHEFQEFLLSDGYDIKNLQNDADLPDEVDKDNIEQDADIHHAHSYKLEEVTNEQGEKYLKWVGGDGMEKLKMIGSDIHDFYKEGKLDMVRYSLSKGTHYRIDVMTYPHLFKGKPWSLYHQKFEEEMGHFLVQNADKITNIIPKPYKDVYKDCRNTAIDMWYKGKEVVKIYEEEGTLLNHQDICLNTCLLIIKGVCDWWLTMWEKIIKP